MGIDTAGYRGWWPLRAYQGKDRNGKKVGVEVFRNMATGEVHAPANGWNGEPPAPSGDAIPIHMPSDIYRQNYDQIRWDK
jgi:hypothetical protein